MVQHESAPFPTVGILGGGQLGRMLALAALRMGLHVHFLVPEPSAAIAGIGRVTVGDWTDPEVARAFAATCTVVTVESEWAPIESIESAAPHTPCYPTSATLQRIRDKGRQ